MKKGKCLVTVSALLFSATIVLGQESTALGDIELYEFVLDHVFHTESLQGTVALVLRYLPTDSGEFQVQVHETGQDRIELDVWRVPAGLPTIWVQLLDLAGKHPKWRAEDLAQAISVDRSSLLLKRSSTLSRLIMDNRPSQVSLMGVTTLFIDGTSYELVLSSPSKNISVKLSGPQETGISKDPLIRWMGRVRAAVESRLARKTGTSTPDQ